jgi:inner membrane protein
MGEVFAGKKLGKKAMLWGALSQSIADIDFLSACWMNTADSLLAHRGFTHSFLFWLLITPLFALLAEKLHRPHNIRLGRWLLFFGGVIFSHIFIDAFNNYGVGWLEPFSHRRISFNAIYIADPFFSVWPGMAFLFLLVMKKKNSQRTMWLRIGLGISGLYLIYCLSNKYKVNRDVKEILQKQQISYSRYFSTPAPLQNWLWYVVAGNDSGYHVGYYSVFDSKKEISFRYFPRNDSLLQPLRNQEELYKLIRFSQQFYTVELKGDTLVFNDLRFGQITGWHQPDHPFVFHYYLQHPGENRLVVQRGRFTGWNQETIRSLFYRIKGN